MIVKPFIRRVARVLSRLLELELKTPNKMSGMPMVSAGRCYR